MSKLAEMFKEVNTGREVKRNRNTNRNVREGKINEDSIKVRFPYRISDIEKVVKSTIKNIEKFYKRDHNFKTVNFNCEINIENYNGVPSTLSFDVIDTLGNQKTILFVWIVKPNVDWVMCTVVINHYENKDLSKKLTKFLNTKSDDSSQTDFLKYLPRFIQHNDYEILQSLEEE